ncbi:MAG: tetratricopeptide repeat protein, partial [Akkermansiaceae bacterium]|nr:tetratricopeptide repeat protein [Akkermansiaceae bacterium]
YRLVQGAGAPRDLTRPPRETALSPADQEPAPPSQVARVLMAEPSRVAPSPILGFDGEAGVLPIGSGRLLLVNLWAQWCAPCRVELNEFARRHDEIQAAGIDLLALSVDGLGPNASEEGVAEAARFAAEAGWPFPAARATGELVTDFQALHDLHIPRHRELPLPSSFLVDPEGRLAVIYKGPVSVDRLLADAALGESERPERLARSALLAGRVIGHPVVAGTADRLAEFLHFERATRLKASGHVAEVAAQYADVLAFKPDSHGAHNNLGNALRALGRPEEALDHYRKATELAPESIDAWSNHGLALQELGKFEEAAGKLREAMRLDPANAVVNYNLANLSVRSGDLVTAKEHYLRALEAAPGLAEAHNNLGNILHREGKLDEALDHYRQAAQSRPGYADAHNNLGLVLQKQGKTAEAVAQFTEALRIDPARADIHEKLGHALLRQGDASRAVQHLTRALQLRPDLPQALFHLARIRASHPDPAFRDGSQAVVLAQQCATLTRHRVAGVLDVLAAACAEAGRFPDAVDWQTKALELATAEARAGMQSRLVLYQAGQPFRDITLK